MLVVGWMITLDKHIQIITIETFRIGKKSEYPMKHDLARKSKRSSTYLFYCYFSKCRLLGCTKHWHTYPSLNWSLSVIFCLPSSAAKASGNRTKNIFRDDNISITFKCKGCDTLNVLAWWNWKIALHVWNIYRSRQIAQVFEMYRLLKLFI